MILIIFVISNQLANISYLLKNNFVLDSSAIIYIYIITRLDLLT
jgi:hypothetical protein